jgi:hypothetical protein
VNCTLAAELADAYLSAIAMNSVMVLGSVLLSLCFIRDPSLHQAGFQPQRTAPLQESVDEYLSAIAMNLVMVLGLALLSLCFIRDPSLHPSVKYPMAFSSPAASEELHSSNHPVR